MTAIESGYRLLSYSREGRPTAGVLVGDRVHAAADLIGSGLTEAGSVLGILERWDEAHPALVAAVEALDAEAGTPFAEVTLLAPILYPRGLFCAGANYWDHLEEMDGPMSRDSRAEEPWFFLKTSAHSIISDGATVPIPAKFKQLDWEAELAVVIGREARAVKAADAGSVIAGCTILNDLSARDLMLREDRPPAMAYDWIGQKCFDGAAPMGPWLTPLDYIDDIHDLEVKLWVGDELKQDSHTSNLIHDVFEQIEWLSGQLTLLPGDVIATGSPAGVGMPRGEFLAPGDVTRIEIEGCGTLVTHFS